MSDNASTTKKDRVAINCSEIVESECTEFGRTASKELLFGRYISYAPHIDCVEPCVRFVIYDVSSTRMLNSILYFLPVSTQIHIPTAQHEIGTTFYEGFLNVNIPSGIYRMDELASEFDDVSSTTRLPVSDSRSETFLLVDAEAQSLRFRVKRGGEWTDYIAPFTNVKEMPAKSFVDFPVFPKGAVVNAQ